MKHYIYTLLIALATCTKLMAQEPKQVLTDLVTKIEQTSFKANYTLTITENPTNAPQVFRGSILMKSNQFHLQMDGFEVFYDGKVQWAYLEDADEITITEPTLEEVAEINPIIMAKTMLGNCEVRFSEIQKTTDTYFVDLYPKQNQSDVLRLTIQIRKTDLIPLSMTMKSRKGLTTELKLLAPQYGVPTTTKSFVLDTAQYPDAILNDLR